MEKDSRSNKSRLRPIRLQPQALRPAETRVPLGSVDFLPGERQRAMQPIRPPDWKPKPRFISQMRVQLDVPLLEQRHTAVKVTLATGHRLMKSRRMHTEISYFWDDLRQPAIFDDLEAGDYALVFQPAGYRPYVHLLHFHSNAQDFRLAFPLHPVEDSIQERELLRSGEQHPFLLHMRTYLVKHGYLQEGGCHCSPALLCEHLSAALALFQRVFHLEATASLSVEALLKMLQPRCPLPDFPASKYLAGGSGTPGQAEIDPIVFTPNRWDYYNLSYTFFQGTSDITNEWDIIKSAMEVWADQSPLKFSQAQSGSAYDISYSFIAPTDPGYPFDKGGSMASPWPKPVE
jgi:hypothetical protein